ncbi:hypothetical protein CA13_65560 [Planctomycetes bacterium CA13]|uniref:Uncharacterized protein n=1 Tax=Novipirellula herctigrandis TaxID=2527986 RepID=A0A5C5ZCM1_9BACT|nr:hypothetical protein CA13_65560 [Planctomycetes bacterium CA13]
MTTTTTLRLFDELAASERESLTNSFDQRHDTIASTNEVILATASECRQRGWKTHEGIWNPCLFLNTVAYDLSHLVFDLAYEEDTWKRGLCARHLATLLFEIAEDMPQVFGKRFNQSIETLNVPQELRENFRSRMKGVSRFWQDHRAELKDVRTVCGAHRDHDALTMLRAISDIDLVQILRLGISLGTMLNELGSEAQAILTNTSATRPPEQDN